MLHKLVLAICLVALVLSAVNTALLLQVSGRLKELGDKIEPLAKEVEKVQPILRELSKVQPLPTVSPPTTPQTPTRSDRGESPKPPLPAPFPKP